MTNRLLTTLGFGSLIVATVLYGAPVAPAAAAESPDTVGAVDTS